MFQISTLEHRYAVGEVVACERTKMESSPERKRPANTIGPRVRQRFQICADLLGMHHSLIDLDDHAVRIDEERGGQSNVSSPIEQVAIQDVVNTDRLLPGEQNRELNALLIHD